jgi:uncharacterized membrane protein
LTFVPIFSEASSMNNLLVAAAFFVVLHRGVSGSPLRQRLVGAFGESTYARLFQLASLSGVLWLGVAYSGAGVGGVPQGLWAIHPAAVWVQLLLQPLAVLLIIAGITTPNPGTFGQEAVAESREPVRGMLRLTRHPFLWGIGLFAVGHLLVTSTPRGLVLFGTLAFVALSGTLSIDAKRRRSLGPKWAAFEAQTSNLPFVAIVDGRQKLSWGEIGWWRPLMAAGVAILLALVHPRVFGVAVLP